jgi:hypothetical protein
LRGFGLGLGPSIALKMVQAVLPEWGASRTATRGATDPSDEEVVVQTQPTTAFNATFCG